MKIKHIFCDVDGTLLDSIPIKNEIFIDVLRRQGIPPDFSRPIMLSTIALTRMARFKKVWSKYYKSDIPVDTLQQLLTQADEQISSVYFPLIEGAEHFIREISSKIPIYIITAAGETEIAKNFNFLKWTNLVNTIICNVADKETVFRSLIHQNQCSNAEYLSIGDTVNDCIAAINVEIKFWVITQQIESSIIDSKFCLGYSKDLNSMLKQINSIIL